MASQRGQIASSSSSARRWTYDAFLSFCGRDTRMGFTDHLYTGLVEKGLFVFRDDEKLEQGEKISENLLGAIQESKYAIVVISEHYAFSKWCLNELVEIVECMRNGWLTIFPVFYHVDPSDVRNQKGIFAEAFANHTKATENDKMLWSAALKEVGDLVGWHIHDRLEAKICIKIVDEKNCDLQNKFSNLVGIEDKVQELMSLLCLEDNDVCFIEICGIGGIGKTTLAKVIYNKVSSKFESSCFINNVRERSGDLLSLQKEILLQIFNYKNIERWNSPQVEGALRERLQNKKVFFVLDDVDKEKQLQELAGIDWFGLGSRILITSRDHGLLDKYNKEICVVPNRDNQLLNKCVKIYKVEEMNFDDALQLFSWEAFRKTYPEENYVEISKEIVRYAQHLPLALKVFGSFLFDSTMAAWESARDRLKKELSAEILDKLQISFDGLDECQKRLFLDIACFFKGEYIKKVSSKLKALGHFLDIDIPILERKSLIKISRDQIFEMHDLLQEMAYRIVRHEFPNEPGRWSRLWRWEDILYVLKNDTGTDAIESIVIKTPRKAIKTKVNVKALSKMKKLKMLVISNNNLLSIIGGKRMRLKWIGDPSKLKLSNELCFLEWDECPLEFLPNSFKPNNLVELKMTNSCIKRLWDSNKRFNKLRCIVVRGSRNLLEMPNFEAVPNLQHFDGKDTLISRLPSSTVQMTELHDLSIGGRYPVTISPPISFSSLKSLKSLNLSGCNLVDGVPDNLVLLSSLEELILDENNFTKISVDISRLSNLRYLGLLNCPELGELPPKLPLSLRVISVHPWARLAALYNPMNLLPSSEKWVDGRLSLDAYYFGYSGLYRRTLHLSHKSSNYLYGSSARECFKRAAAWGPTLVSEIPMWFNQRSTNLVDAPGTIQCRIDLKLNDFFSDTRVSTSHFQLHKYWPEDWGYALFIVYEALDPDDCERRKKQKIGEDENSNSRIIPMIACELQHNKYFGRVPLVFRVPEARKGEDGVWVFMNGFCFYKLWYLPQLSKSYSITIRGLNVKVKKCRGRFFRKDDYSEFYEILRSISPLGIDSESLKTAFFRDDSRLSTGVYSN